MSYLSYIIFHYILYVVDLLLTHGHMRANASWLILEHVTYTSGVKWFPEKSEKLQNAIERLLQYLSTMLHFNQLELSRKTDRCRCLRQHHHRHPHPHRHHRHHCHCGHHHRHRHQNAIALRILNALKKLPRTLSFTCTQPCLLRGHTTKICKR